MKTGVALKLSSKETLKMAFLLKISVTKKLKRYIARHFGF
jgi:hypothetical protein